MSKIFMPLKKRYDILFLSLFLLLTITCTTKDGLDFGRIDVKLYVYSSNADSARIFLDYRDTGKSTPTLLDNISEGRHIIHLFKSTYRTEPDSSVVTLRATQTDTVRFELHATPHGNLLLDSDPDSARILLNGLDFGFTPINIIGLPVGEYFIQVLKGSFNVIKDTVRLAENDSITLFYPLQEDLRKQVLLEHFSNTSCPPCPQSDAIVDELANSYSAWNLVVIAYHTNFPSPSDPMYLSGTAANNSRVNYYKPSSIPRAIVDGVVVGDPLSEQSYRDLIDEHLQQEIIAKISFQQLARSTTLISGRLNIEALNDLTDNHILHIALIQDELNFDTSPGTNGQKHFKAVLRSLYPDGNGQEIFLSQGQNKKINFVFSLSADWASDLSVVAFIQEVASQKVIQASWTRYPPL
jgi:thiol-disulfide isomerase/thioredoxin